MNPSNNAEADRPELPPGMELLQEGQTGGQGLTEVLAGVGGAGSDPAVIYSKAIYDIVEHLLASSGTEFIPQALRTLRKAVFAAQRIALVAWPPEPDGTFRNLIPVEGEWDGRAFISMSLARYAVEKRRALLLSEEKLPEGLEYAKSMMLKGIRSAIYVPLQASTDSEITGLLCVDSPNALVPLTSQHFQFICAVGGLLATTLSTERLRQQARIQALEAQRIEARREGLATFLKIASHDLKNPLSAISVGAHLLRRAKPEKYEGLINIILNASERATDLIKTYLDVSEVESGEMRLELEHIVPRDLVEGEIEFLRNAMPERLTGITLVNQVHCPPIQVDGRKIGQVFANLISNAVKYSPAGGEIVVGCEVSPEKVTFSVRDHGLGISGEDQKRLFAAFQRVGDRNVAPGTGLGLWLIQSLVRAHGGHVSLTSSLGEGSTFFFSLPRPETAP